MLQCKKKSLVLEEKNRIALAVSVKTHENPAPFVTVLAVAQGNRGGVGNSGGAPMRPGLSNSDVGYIGA